MKYTRRIQGVWGVLGVVAAGLGGCESGPEPAAATPASAASPATAQSAPAKPAPTDDWTIRRVAGDLAAQITKKDGMYYFGSGWSRMSITTPLPQGYPDPTPPGAIDLKRYPSVRRAEFASSNLDSPRQRQSADAGMDNGFWPLFRHIKKRNIAMTSPVEMEYNDVLPASAPQPSAGEPRWTMSFLYRTPELGPTGEDGQVRVFDTEPVTVLAMGLKGEYKKSKVEAAVREMEAWLQTKEGQEWEPAGNARAFYYNGPEVWVSKWAEAQLPVRKRVAR